MNPALSFSNNFKGGTHVLHALETLRSRVASKDDLLAEEVIAYLTGDDTLARLRDRVHELEALVAFFRAEMPKDVVARAEKAAERVPKRSKWGFWF